MKTPQDPKSSAYDFLAIEKKWQAFWLESKAFKTEDVSDKPKFYALDMFPYPSGAGLHVGHPEGYTATDIISRYKRMCGFNVLHPMGWDAFGLPAEQYAVKTGTHPRITTDQNINRFREQIQALGLSYDWDREIDTTDPKYYRWTQWIFLQLFHKGLAYESFAPVNWCPELGTVLANEEVIDGKSEVGGHPVIKKPMRQWVFKITEYAERLLEDLEPLDWPDAIKQQQRNWIGRSEGAEVNFTIGGHADETLRVFTTRPDTLFGATFMVLAPEHAAVEKITATAYRAKVDEYVEKAKARSERDRMADTSKTGVNTGAFAINPVNQEKIPIFIADYVLISYGHGAIMAVPGHDQRDHEFAKQYGLPIKRVITGGKEDIEQSAHAGDGECVHSDFLNGLNKEAAITAMTTWLEENKFGKKTITYKLRDWLFSRQRYWGEPIPIVHDKDNRPVPLAESELPVTLPQLEDFKPSGDGESPLAKVENWLDVERDGAAFKRETNTMPQWAGSCWYYLRFIDPLNQAAAWDKKKEQHWMPVDLYVGGAEHAVLHLLYARFWHKVLYDLGHVSTKEPFQKLVNQGMILGENNEKMSKSRGNVVNPDDIIRDWGADSMRLYEMFMGPLEAAKPWNTQGIGGVHRFLKRVWRLLVAEDGSLSEYVDAKPESDTLKKMLHKTIKKVTEDTESLRFNTAIAAMMELSNAAYKEESISKEAASCLVQLLAPYAPHVAEELWQRLGNPVTITYQPWPTFDPALVQDDMLTVSVQVNGKLRGTIEVAVGSSKDSVLAAAKQLDSVQRHTQGKAMHKEIYVPGKIVNFVIG